MNDESESRTEEIKGCRKFIKKVGNWLAHKDKDEWSKDMRGMLSLVATVIATMTFQCAINPPGGVRPANETGILQCNRTDTDPCPGQAVLAVVHPAGYTKFLYWNTTCFVASSAVCLLLVSGLPLNHRFFTWLLSIGMCITLTSLTFTYFSGIMMVTPDLLQMDSMLTVFGLVLFIWMILLGIITLFLFLRLIIWIVIKLIEKQVSKGKDSKQTKGEDPTR